MGNISEKKDKILVVSPQFLGDSVLSVPFFKNLRLNKPNSIIDVITKNAGIAVLSSCPYIDSIYNIKNPDITILKNKNYDKVYVLKRSLSAAILGFKLHIPQRIGFGSFFRNFLLTKSIKYQKTHQHEKDSFLDILRVDNIEITDSKLHYWIDDNALDNLSDDYFSINYKNALVVASSTTFVKDWDKEKFANIIDYLKQHDYRIFFLGLKSERKNYEEITNILKSDENIFNLCGDLTFEQTVAAISKMNLVFGIDTGFAHLASAFNIPTIAMFGPTSTTQWKLLGDNSYTFSLNLNCSPCEKPKKCNKNYACMKNISAEQMIELLEKQIPS